MKNIVGEKCLMHTYYVIIGRVKHLGYDIGVGICREVADESIVQLYLSDQINDSKYSKPITFPHSLLKEILTCFMIAA